MASTEMNHQNPPSRSPGRAPIGPVIRGSLSRGVEARLGEGQHIERLRAGQLAVLDGREHEFFGMITDLALASASPEALESPPSPALPSFAEMVQGTTHYGVATIRPSLMRRRGAPPEEVEPAKTVPGHFSPAYVASAADVQSIFGRPGDADGGMFEIGSPLAMAEIPLCLNLPRLVERSCGIFGKSGTGKTFLTRLVLAGLLAQGGPRPPVTLVFDMHNEYGHGGRIEGEGGAGGYVKGLREYFCNGQVAVFSVGPEALHPVDFQILIPYRQLEPGDILLLRAELNLTPTAAECAYLAAARFGRDWFNQLLNTEPETLVEQFPGNVQAIAALQRRLGYLQQLCHTFLLPDARVSEEQDAVDRILGNLNRGVHTIVEFGRCRHPLQYMLVANLLTRRLHERYVRMTEEFLASKDPAREPRQAVVVIEEAHKFLSPELASQTIFGTIAREMRKYYVTLLLVDQRPSGIDPEIMSQLGTKIACLLDNDRDVDAVLAGVSGGAGLRSVLASLSTKQQALILGHAVPMPVVIDTRRYGDAAFDRALGYEAPETRRARVRQLANELGV